jgi:hypothetical protein
MGSSNADSIMRFTNTEEIMNKELEDRLYYVYEIDKYKTIKQMIKNREYDIIGLQSSYRGLTHHLDRMIVKLTKQLEQIDSF